MNKIYRALLETGGLSGRLSLALSLLACYGTLALVGLLSALGIALAVDEGTWAGAILIFAWASLASLAHGRHAHGSSGPVATGLAGAGLLTYTLLLDYRPVTEIAAFAILALASFHDFRRRRSLAKETDTIDGDAARAC